MRYEVVLIASNKHASARLTYIVDAPNETRAGVRAVAMAKDHYTECSTVYIGPEHEVKAVLTGGGAVYRLGQYETAEIARAVLNDLYIHIATGCTYQMPNDKRAQVLARGMSDERPDKFAGNGKKAVRRGGS